MKKRRIMAAFVSLMLMSLNAGAVEVKPTIKGSFRNLYPNAIVVHSTHLNNGRYAGIYEGGTLISLHQNEIKRVLSSMEKYASEECKGSEYAILDHFEVHHSINEDNIFITEDANLICFNLPKNQKSSGK